MEGSKEKPKKPEMPKRPEAGGQGAEAPEIDVPEVAKKRKELQGEVHKGEIEAKKVLTKHAKDLGLYPDVRDEAIRDQLHSQQVEIEGEKINLDEGLIRLAQAIAEDDTSPEHALFKGLDLSVENLRDNPAIAWVILKTASLDGVSTKPKLLLQLALEAAHRGKDSDLAKEFRNRLHNRLVSLYEQNPDKVGQEYLDKVGEIIDRVEQFPEKSIEWYGREEDGALRKQDLENFRKKPKKEEDFMDKLSKLTKPEPAGAEPPSGDGNREKTPKNDNGDEKNGETGGEPEGRKDDEQQKTIEEILEYVKKLIDQLQPIQDLPASMESVADTVKDLGDKLGLQQKVSAEEARRNRERVMGNFGNFIYNNLPQFVGIDPLSDEYFRELKREGITTEEKRDSEERREEYIRNVIGEIRETLETLENTRTTMWHINGLTVEEQYLNSLFSRVLYPMSRELEEYSIGEDSFPDIYDRMAKEISGRQWLHINNLLFMRSTPGHIEDLVKGIMELRDIAEVKWISKIPGFGNAWRSLERDGIEFIRFEGREEQEEIKERARHAAESGEEQNEALKEEDSIKHDREQRGIWSAGITGKAAAELAERYHRIVGREAEWVRMYAQEYRVVYYGENEGKDKFSLKQPGIDDIEEAEKAMEGEQVNKTFDPYRFSYYPHLLWQFFGVGGKTEGKDKNFIINRRTITGKVVPVQVRIESGKGMGRAIRKTLFETGFDLPVSDWVSRRMHGYILPGWIEEQKANNPDFWEEKLKKREGETKKEAEERQLSEFCDAMGISEVDEEKLKGGPRDLLDMSPDERLKLVHGGFEDFSKYRIEDTPWDYISRQHENVRAHVRDHAVVLENLNKMFGYINYPTLKNLLSLGGLSGIADLGQVQAYFHRPLYESFEEVRRGRSLGRFSFGKGIFRIGKSIGEEVAGWETLKMSTLAKVRQILVRGQKLPKIETDFRGTGNAIFDYLRPKTDIPKNISEEEREKLEAEREKLKAEAKEKINTALEAFYDWFQREAYDFVDPDLLLVVILGLAASQLQQLETDLTN